jgi:transcriptional regulator with XRE-family HTH domain
LIAWLSFAGAVARTAKEPDLEFQAVLGDKLRSARLRARLSQEELAFAADVSPRHVSNIERGLTNPGVVQIARLAHVLRLQPGSLMPRIDAEGRPVRDTLEK